MLLLVTLAALLHPDLFAQQEGSHQQKALVFTHVTVIDATGAPAQSNMTVVVRGDRIEALGTTANLDVPENAQVVDATGKFLIPGLWDMHAHPQFGKRYLALFTANGVTGIRVMSGVPEHHKWREEISSGQLIGPRMLIGSSPVGSGPDDFPAGSDEGEGRQVVRRIKKEGADFVKVYNYIPRNVYFAIADEAEKQGIPFAGHVPYSVSAFEASDAGQHSIEHGHGVSPACSDNEEEYRENFLETRPTTRARVKLLAELTYNERKAAALFASFAENNTWVCPTALVWSEVSSREKEDLANDPRLKYMPLSIKDYWNPKSNGMIALATGDGRADCRRLVQKKIDNVGAMGRAGVGLLAGTDTPLPYCFPGFGLHDELALFVRGGLSPMEALKAATYNPAKFFDSLDSMGTIEPGKIADLVLLEDNPLENISNTQKIAGVVSGGRFFDKTALQKMLAQVEAAPLHEAAAAGNIEDVNVLVSEGADVNARDQRGLTPTLVALIACELAVVDLLLEKGPDTTAPHLAAYTGDLDLRGIKSLLAQTDDPVDSLEGLTLLHAAAAGGHIDVVEYLIAEGFEATAITEDNKTTPLHLAAAAGNEEVAELLIDKGANVHAKDGKGRAPLHLAVQYGDVEVAQTLLAEGVDLKQENSDGETPLHVAAENGYRTIAELLIESGAEVDKKRKWGSTPLHFATSAGHKDVASLLIARGANVNVRDDQQRTPLQFAAGKGHKDVLELLLAKGADVNAKDRRGKSPLSMAKAKGHRELVELLRKHGAKE